MFVSGRQEVLDGIAVMGARACLYSATDVEWARRCDCKYGVSPESYPGGEQTGCPELRAAHHVISRMSEDEWARFILRTGPPPPPYDSSRPCSHCGYHDSDGGCNCG